MPRPIWSGSISFGLVSVPVRLFTAVRKQDIRFHQLHAADGVRIQQKRVCPADGQELGWDDLVKGYEITKGSYVVVQPEELEALSPASSHTVDIEDFVALDQIDPLYFDTSYYLVPDKAGTKAYRLLAEAMAEAGRVGIGRVVMRTKQYLCAIRPLGQALVLTTLNFADEVTGQDELEGLPGAEVSASERELAMAHQLIESLTTDFEPDHYHDTYRQAVLDLVEAKAAGQDIVSAPEAPAAPVLDLMAALEASLARGGGAGKDGRGGGAAGKAGGGTGKAGVGTGKAGGPGGEEGGSGEDQAAESAG